MPPKPQSKRVANKRISVHARDVISQPLQDIPNSVSVFISREGGVDSSEAQTIFSECSHLLLRAEEAVADQNPCAFLSLMRLLSEAFAGSAELEAEGKAVFDKDSALVLSIERICHGVLNKVDGLGLPGGDNCVGMDTKQFALLGDYPQAVAVAELLQVLGVLCSTLTLKRRLGPMLMPILKSALLQYLWAQGRGYGLVGDAVVDAESESEGDDGGTSRGSQAQGRRSKKKAKTSPRKKLSKFTALSPKSTTNPFSQPEGEVCTHLSLEGARYIATIFINLTQGCDENKRLITWEFLPDAFALSLDVYFQIQVVELMYRLYNKGPFAGSQLVKLWKRRSPVSTAAPEVIGVVFDEVVDEIQSLSSKKKEPLLQQMVRLVDAFHNAESQLRAKSGLTARSMSFPTKRVLVANHALTSPRSRVYFCREHLLILLGDATADQVSLPYTYIRSVKVSADNTISFRLYLAPTRARDLIKIDSAVGEDTISFEMTAPKVADFRASPVQQWIVERLKARTAMAGSARRSSAVTEKEVTAGAASPAVTRGSTTGRGDVKGGQSSPVVGGPLPRDYHHDMTPASGVPSTSGAHSSASADFIDTVERGTERGSLINAARPHQQPVPPRDSLEEAIQTLMAGAPGEVPPRRDSAPSASATQVAYAELGGEDDDDLSVREIITRMSASRSALVSPSKEYADASPAPRSVRESPRHISVDPDLQGLFSNGQLASPGTPSFQQLAVRLDFDATADRPQHHALQVSHVSQHAPSVQTTSTRSSPPRQPQPHSPPSPVGVGRRSAVLPESEHSSPRQVGTLSTALVTAFNAPSPAKDDYFHASSRRAVDTTKVITAEAEEYLSDAAIRPTANPGGASPLLAQNRSHRYELLQSAAETASDRRQASSGGKRPREEDLEAALAALAEEVARLRSEQQTLKDAAQGTTRRSVTPSLGTLPATPESIAGSLRAAVDDRHGQLETQMHSRFEEVVDQVQGTIDAARKQVFVDVSQFEAKVCSGLASAEGAEKAIRARVDEMLETYNARLDALKKWSRGDAKDVVALARITADRALGDAREGHTDVLARMDVTVTGAFDLMTGRIQAAEYLSRPPSSAGFAASHALRRSASSTHPTLHPFTPIPTSATDSALEPFRQFLASRMS